jgi:cell wall-associated NlpC family hydrolase
VHGNNSIVGRIAIAVGACLCAGQLLATPARADDSIPTPPPVTAPAPAPVPVATAAALGISNTRPNDGAVVTFTGRVTRGASGTYAYLQSRTARGWRTVAKGKLVGGKLSLRRAHRGALTYRLYYPAQVRDGAVVLKASASATRRVVGRTTSERVMAEAAKLRGRPYVFGASGPRAFDCSGLTQYVYRKFGKRLPHNADAQQRRGKAVPKSQARPGDLIVFRSGGHGYHVGIYAGGGYMWDAPHAGARVGKRKIWSRDYVVRRIV